MQPLSRRTATPTRSSLPRGRERLVHRARPRVPVVPRAPTDGHGLRRVAGHPDPPAGSADRGAVVPDKPRGPVPGRGQQHVESVVLADGHRRVHQLAQCPVPPEQGVEDVPVRLVVGRRRADPQRDGARHEPDVHGEVPLGRSSTQCRGLVDQVLHAPPGRLEEGSARRGVGDLVGEGAVAPVFFGPGLRGSRASRLPRRRAGFRDCRLTPT